MDRLDQLKVFVRVAELGSFTRAAEAMDLQKGAASVAVQQLENTLGTRLLQRTTRRVELTHDGRACYERARDLLSDADDLEGLFHQTPQRLAGRLRVDMPVGIAQFHVIPRLPEFTAPHPGLQVEVSATDRRVDLIREGFDCVLRVGRVEEPSLVVRSLGHARVATFASPAYLAHHGTPHTLEDLSGHRLINYAVNFGGQPEGWEYFDGERWREIPLERSITVNNSAAYDAACLAGYGLIQVPLFGAGRHVVDGSLVQVLPQYEAQPMPVSLLYAHRRHLPLRVRAFMNWIEELLRPLLIQPGGAGGR
jgi:DNA-binding transcriptional LysR family regulator